MSRHARRRGFTLLELLMGAAVSSIILMGVAAAFVAVQASYQAEAEVKSTVENGRTSLSYIERSLRLAGYGLDPRHAIDFGNIPGLTPGIATKDNQPVAGLANINTDDLAFRYRDPGYRRRGQLVGTNVQLEAGQTWDVALPVGTVLLVACRGGREYAVVRTTALAAAGSAAAAGNAYGAPFVNSTQPCLTSAGVDAPFVLLVHEVRLRIINLGTRPWLVAFRSLADDVTNAATVFDPLASDVESFQVSYAMNRPPPTGGCCSATLPVDNGASTGNSNWVLGDASNEVPGGLFPDPAANAPSLDTPYDDVLRYNRHPANIRAVRVGLALRSSRLEPTKRRGFYQHNLENATGAVTVPDGYYRAFMTGAVRVPNLASRSFFVPALKTTGDSTDSNIWGG